MAPQYIELLDIERVRRIAYILGPMSAAQDALDDYDRRRAAGECVAIFRDKAYWLVGPLPSELDPREN